MLAIRTRHYKVSSRPKQHVGVFGTRLFETASVHGMVACSWLVFLSGMSSKFGLYI